MYSFAITPICAALSAQPKGKALFRRRLRGLARGRAWRVHVGPGDCDHPGCPRHDRPLLGSNFLCIRCSHHENRESPGTYPGARWGGRHTAPGSLWSSGRKNHLLIDFANSHVVMLNQYFDGLSSSAGQEGLPEATLQWSLTTSREPKASLLVVGHKPIGIPADNGQRRVRHAGDPEFKPRRWPGSYLLRSTRSGPYLRPHAQCLVARVKGIWQLDAGHARAQGTGARALHEGQVSHAPGWMFPADRPLKLRAARTWSWSADALSSPYRLSYRRFERNIIVIIPASVARGYLNPAHSPGQHSVKQQIPGYVPTTFSNPSGEWSRLFTNSVARRACPVQVN